MGLERLRAATLVDGGDDDGYRAVVPEPLAMVVVVVEAASSKACQAFLEAQGQSVFEIGRIAKRTTDAVTLH